MRITHIRLRALRSHASGYGHDAAEIEFALDPGDDPDEVTQRIRQRIDDELRHGAEGRKLNATLDDLRADVTRLADARDAIEADLERFKETAEACNAFLAAAKEKGLELPAELRNVGLPF